MQAGRTETALDPRLAAVAACGYDEERELLHEILRSGVDQGWFLRCDDELLVCPSPAAMERFLRTIAERPEAPLTEADPWAGGGPAAQPIKGDEPGWVMLTQRCDLIRALRVEPLVEVARAVHLKGDAVAAAKAGSARFVAFAPAESGGVWAADLRQRALLPKSLLMQVSPIPAIDTERARKQFRLRLGQRYWRDPVPTDLVETLQRPLRDAVRRSSSRIAQMGSFSMWLGLRSDDGRVIVLAVAAKDREAEAEEDWLELMEWLEAKLPEAHALIEPHRSGVYTADDIPLGLWLEAFKFDFDEISYSRRAGDDHTPPAC
jgi:hypothetical protein